MSTTFGAPKKAKKSRHEAPKKIAMPMCDYGLACNRKGCIYRHPPKDSNFVAPGAPPAPIGESRPICVHYLVGSCVFSSKCSNLHIHGEDEKEKILKRIKTLQCKFGSECTTEGCMYLHDTPITPAPATTVVIAEPPPRYISATPFIPSIAAPAFVPSFMRPVTMATSIVPDAVFRPPTSVEASRMAPAATSVSVDVFGGKKTARIPLEIWVSEDRRNPGLYAIADPIERFKEVNKPHDERSSATKDAPVVIDLHFLTAMECMTVLDKVLPEYAELGRSRGAKDMWVITGSGHHSVVGANAPGKLFKIVQVYLDTSKAYEYHVGKDISGFASGFKLLL